MIFRRLINWIKYKFSFRIKPSINHAGMQPFAPSAQEDPRTVQSVKNVRKAFKQQQQQMDARALKAHDASCKDMWTCVADPCYKHEPLRVVNIETVSADRYNTILKKNKKILKKMNKQTS